MTDKGSHRCSACGGRHWVGHRGRPANAEEAPPPAVEVQLLKRLIAWIGVRLVRRDGNGAPTDRICLLCLLGQPEFRRQPCRHAEIWGIAKEVEEYDKARAESQSAAGALGRGAEGGTVAGTGEGEPAVAGGKAAGAED